MQWLLAVGSRKAVATTAEKLFGSQARRLRAKAICWRRVIAEGEHSQRPKNNWGVFGLNSSKLVRSFRIKDRMGEGFILESKSSMSRDTVNDTKLMRQPALFTLGLPLKM
jgi:hypothetical protein